VPEFSFVGKWLVGVGLILTVIGAFFWIGGRIPLLGRLPGDIRIEGEHLRLYLPLATCILLSTVASLTLWLFHKFK
jgi:hypothetical protein